MTTTATTAKIDPPPSSPSTNSGVMTVLNEVFEDAAQDIKVKTEDSAHGLP